LQKAIGWAREQGDEFSTRVHHQSLTSTAGRWHEVSRGNHKLMKTQNIVQALYSLAFVAAIATPVFAQDAASRARVDAASTPTSPANTLSSTTSTNSNQAAATADIGPAATPRAGTILPAPDRTSAAGGTISGSLDVSHAVSAIEGVETNDRDKLLGEIASRESSVDQQVTSLKSKASDVKPDVRDAINSAWSDYEKAKARLDQSMQKSRTTAGPEWERFRSELAADYAFFASAVAGLEVALPN